MLRASEEPVMDATAMFLGRHQRLHRHVDRSTLDLTEAEIRSPVHPAVNPLAWLLWHMARAEDAAVNLLVVDGMEVLDEAWRRRLHVPRTDVGSGMSRAEVLDLSDAVDLGGLAAYWHAVGIRTRYVVGSLSPASLDEVVSRERVAVAAARSTTGHGAAALEELWRGSTAGEFLVWLPLTHNCEHAGQADLVRGMLGRPGRY